MTNILKRKNLEKPSAKPREIGRKIQNNPEEKRVCGLELG